MVETLIVIGVATLLAVLGIAVPLLPAEWWIQAGYGCAALGLVLGIPTGFWYHVVLRRALAAQGDVPPRWWLRPVALHPRLGVAGRAAVLPWFYAGGLGFLVTVAGCGAITLGVLVQAARAGLL